MPPKIDRVGPYEVKEKLGSGGMGTVYRAVDSRNGQTVALKVLRSELAEDEDYVRRFRREATIVKELDSPHIVPVLDYGQDDDQHYLAMQYVEGQSLAQRLRDRGRLPPEEARTIAIQVALALDAAHRKGIVHRDIKPGNILIAQDGTVKVADFGIARATGSTKMTRTGFLLGTVQYMAPDVTAGATDIRYDIYSLGIVIFEMLTGRVPFEADTPWAVMRMHEGSPPPSLESLGAHVSTDLRAVVARCLAKRPEGRYQSPEELVAALEGRSVAGAVATVGEATDGVPPGDPSGSILAEWFGRSGWRLALLGVGIVGVALAAVIIAVAARSGGGEELRVTKEGTPEATTVAGARAETPKATTSAGGGAAPANQQKIVVQSGEPEFFDPHRSNFEQDIAVERMLFRGLYQLVLTDSGEIKAAPAMAVGEPTVSGAVYTIKLKSGLKWSDGQPLTAKDFEYGIKRECSPDVAGPYQYLLGESILNIVGCDDYFNGKGTAQGVGVKAIDDATLEVTLVAPRPTFTTIMSLWAAFPVRQDIVERYGEKWTDPANIVVNGPFILTEFVPKDHVTLKPNPNWALEPKPALQEITVKFIDDTEVAFRAFQTNELDMTLIPAAEIPTVEGDTALKSQYVKVSAGRIWSVEMQMNNEILKDYNVRLALSRAIDRATLVKVVYNDAYVPATYWLVEGIPGHQSGGPFESIIGYDPAAAKKALADAGYPNGAGFPGLKLTTLDRPDRKAEAEFLQKAWKETLGIDVSIETVDAKTRAQTFNSKEFELFPGGWQIDYPDPENPLIGLFDTGGGNNQYECSDADVDSKLRAASAETDNTKRIKLLQEAETLVVTRLCGAAPIYQTAMPYLVNSKIGGVKPNGLIDAAMPGNWCPECWFVKEE